MVTEGQMIPVANSSGSVFVVNVAFSGGASDEVEESVL